MLITQPDCNSNRKEKTTRGRPLHKVEAHAHHETGLKFDIEAAKKKAAHSTKWRRMLITKPDADAI